MNNEVEYDDFKMLTENEIKIMQKEYLHALEQSPDAIRQIISESAEYVLFLISKIDKLLYFGNLKITLYKFKKCLEKEMRKLNINLNFRPRYTKIRNIRNALIIVHNEIINLVKQISKNQQFENLNNLLLDFSCALVNFL